MSRRYAIMQAYSSPPKQPATIRLTRPSSIYKESNLPPILPGGHATTTHGHHARSGSEKPSTKSKRKQHQLSPYDNYQRSAQQKPAHHDDDKQGVKAAKSKAKLGAQETTTQKAGSQTPNQKCPRKHASKIATKDSEKQEADKAQISKQTANEHNTDWLERSTNGIVSDKSSPSQGHASGHQGRRASSSRDRLFQQTFTKADDDYLHRANNGSIQTEFARLQTLLDKNKALDDLRRARAIEKQQGRIGEILTDCRQNAGQRTALSSNSMINTKIFQMYSPSSAMTTRGGNSHTETPLGKDVQQGAASLHSTTNTKLFQMYGPSSAMADRGSNLYIDNQRAKKRFGRLPPIGQDIPKSVNRLDSKMEYLLSRYNSWEA